MWFYTTVKYLTDLPTVSNVILMLLQGDFILCLCHLKPLVMEEGYLSHGLIFFKKKKSSVIVWVPVKYLEYLKSTILSILYMSVLFYNQKRKI